MGRPPALVEKQRELKRQVRRDELERIPIEGKFGQGKRRFSLARVMCKLAVTSETAITVAFIVMNLERWLQRHFLSSFFASLKRFSALRSVVYSVRTDLIDTCALSELGVLGIATRYRPNFNCPNAVLK